MMLKPISATATPKHNPLQKLPVLPEAIGARLFERQVVAGGAWVASFCQRPRDPDKQSAEGKARRPSCAGRVPVAPVISDEVV